MNICLLETRDLDSAPEDEVLEGDNFVRIRYIHSIVYLLFVLDITDINVRSKKS